jgi:DNA-binding XRE family transcriptional regulator
VQPRAARPVTSPALNQKVLYTLPVHGPDGRIAAVRRKLRMTQAEFGAAIGASRETVSHWENLDENGTPRQRTTRRSAVAIATVARERLGYPGDAEIFFSDDETAWDCLRREQRTISEQLGQALDLLATIIRRLDEASASAPQRT